MDEQLRETNVEEETTGYNSPYSGIAPIDNEKTADFLKWALESDDMLERLKHRMKGEVPLGFNSNGETIWKGYSEKRIMNENGVDDIIFTLEPVLGKEYTTANISEEEAHRITKHTIHTLIDLVYVNYWNWEFKDSKFEWFIKAMDVFIFLALTRVKNAGISKLIKPTLRRIETFGQMKPTSKGGFMGLFRK